MKILHIASGGDRGGAKTHILALCSRLAKSNELTLISLRNGEFADDARAVGINTIEIHSRNIFRDISEMKKLVRDFRPDIVHCHGAKANTAGVFLKYFCKCTVITTVHSDYLLDYMHSFIKRNTLGRINSMALRMVDYRISVSDTFKRMLIGRGFTPSKIMTIYNGLDFSNPEAPFDRAEYLRGLGLDYQEGDIVLGIAARLTAVKDIPTLLKAFASAREKCPNIKLLIGGDGDDLVKLTNLSKSLNIDKSVCFCGWVSEIGKFFKACDIDVLSSISESFPYSILEGIKEQCAVITSNVGGMNTLITSGENGFIFESGDIKTFASHIVTLSTDSELRNSFASKLFARASAVYSLDGMAVRQNEIYRNIEELKSHGKRNNVIICGAYGRGNSGDEAILSAIIKTIRQIDPLIPITVMTRQPKETRLLYGVNSIYTFNFPMFHNAMRHSKLFISGGGSLIQDITSHRSLYFYLYSIRAAKRRGCRVMMYGCGVGHVHNPFNRSLSANVLNKNVDIITLRDIVSAEALLAMGITKPDIRMSADPATCLAPSPVEEANRFLVENGVPAQGRYICFALRPWLNFHNFEIFAQAAKYAYETHNLTAVFLPIEVPRDLSPAIWAAETLKTPHYIISNSPQDTCLTMAVLQKMNMVCGMRLHSIVFSAVAKVPCFAVSYDIKVSGFMKYIGVPNVCTLDEVSFPWLCAQIDDFAANRNEDKLSEIAQQLLEKELVNGNAAAELLCREN